MRNGLVSTTRNQALRFGIVQSGFKFSQKCVEDIVRYRLRSKPIFKQRLSFNNDTRAMSNTNEQ